jgi:amino acid adenylation domain-containing protein
MAEASHRIFDELNATDSDYPRSATAHELFQASVDRTPDSIAVSCGDRRLTYRELEARANQIAHHLRGLGVGAGVLVGVLVERSTDLVAAVLGVHLAGGAQVPLDPAYPLDRIAFMLSDSGAAVLLADRALLDRAARYPGQIVALDAPEIAAAPTARPAPAAGPRDLAHVIYTSGSTGRPKGVEVEHRSLVNFLWAMRTRPGLRADDVLVSVTSASFDPSCLDIYLPLVVGARVDIARRETASDGEKLARRLTDVGATVLQATPSTFRLLIDAGFQGGPSFTALCGGEGLPVDLARDLLARCGALWNLYGPTETTVWSTVHRVDDATPPILVGRPIANMRAYILDRKLRPAPLGAVDELYLGGDGVARGYHGRPDLTAERFLPDPFHPGVEGARLYRTGDLARLTPDGCLEVLGRVDHQVKIRGHRIELGEVEAALSEHPLVRQAVVLAQGEGLAERRLIAYFVTTNSTSARPSSEDLRARLAERLTEAMIPSAFLALDAFPLTPNGKIDRLALSTQKEARAVDRRPGIPPRDSVEEKLFRLWTRLLGIRAIGVTDDFFALGGQSMLGAALIAGIERELGKKLPVKALFEHRTIEALAALVREEGAPRLWPTLARVRPGRGKRPLFFSARPNVNVLGYAALVKYLDPLRPIYILQTRYPEEAELGRPYRKDELAAFAATYLEAMRSVQPEGPYLFGGMCEGAQIGFEMVRLLEASGSGVGLFAILDTWPEENTRDPVLDRVRRVQEEVQSMLQLPPTEGVKRAAGKLQSLFRRVTGATKPDPVEKARWQDRAFPGEGFVATKVRSKLTVFRTREQPYWRIRDTELGWGARTTGGIDVHYIDGRHPLFIREPHAGSLGAALEKVLADIDRRDHAETVGQRPTGDE